MKTPVIEAAGITYFGEKKEKSEDFLSSDETSVIFVVADSTDGHVAQERVSQIAVELINKAFQGWSDSEASLDRLFGSPDPALTVPGNYVLSSIRMAFRVIHELGAQYNHYKGIKTSLSVVAVVPDRIICAVVGQNRIYLVRNGEIEKFIGVDMEDEGRLVQNGPKTEGSGHLEKEDVSQPQGEGREGAEIRLFEADPDGSERFVLSSEGMLNLLSDYEVLNLVKKENRPNALCRALIDQALQRGSQDAATIVSVFLSAADSGK